MVLRNCLVTFPLIGLLMLCTQIASASGGHILGMTTVSASAAQSQTNNGVNVEARMTVMIFNAAASFSKINNEQVVNLYAGFGLPVMASEEGFMLAYLNFGMGSRGPTNKAGIQLRLNQIFEQPIGFTLSRETYRDDSSLDNTQFGITYFFDI
jgi:hypothetical protein